jgi:hypothetical protein
MPTCKQFQKRNYRRVGDGKQKWDFKGSKIGEKRGTTNQHEKDGPEAQPPGSY